MFEPVEVVMQKLVALAQEKGDGQFSIRINAKRASSAIPTSLALFKGGSVEHLNAIESWLPRLVGGGEYIIVVNHETDAGRRFPFSINLTGAPLSHVNTSVVQALDWAGPANLASPNPQSMAQDAQAQSQQPQQQAAQFSPFARPMQMTQPTVQQVMQQPVPQIPVTPAGAQGIAQMAPGAADSYLAVQRAEAAARDVISAKEAALDRRETEERMRREAADRESKLKAEMDSKFDSIKNAILASKPAEKQGADPMAIVAGIAAALAPIAQAFISSSAEARRIQIEMQQRQAEMQMKAQADQAAMQQRMQEQTTALMLKAMEKPSTSPEMQAIFELTRTQSESQGVMMSRIVDAMGTVSKMSIGMIETIADMTAPPEGSPVLDAVKEGTKALLSLANGAEQGGRKAIAAQGQGIPRAQAPQQQLPPQGRPQPTPEQMQAARARAAAVNQQAQAEQAADAAVRAAAVTPPEPNRANVVQFPAQPATPPVAPQSNAAFGDLPDGFGDVQTRDIVQELEDLIRGRHEPVDAVAKFLLDALPTPELQGALKKVGGDPNALLAERLGMVWIMANQDYIEKLVGAIEAQGTERGVFEQDESGEEEAAS